METQRPEQQEVSNMELAEILGGYEKEFVSQIDEDALGSEAESRLEFIANNFADKIELNYPGKVQEAASILKYHSDHPDRGFNVKKLLLRTADVLLENDLKRTPAQEQQKAA